MGTAVRKRTRIPVGAVIGLAAALTGAPAAQGVTCATPDELCTGDPCVVGQTRLPARCVLDFGERTLVIAGALMIPNGGELSLTARDIDVRRAIIGRHAKPFAGLGASITLAASDDIIVRWRIDASARSAPGSITLLAGDDIRLLAPVRAATNGPNPLARGGTITMSAGGTLSAIPRARMRAEGAATTAGGAIALSGRDGVLLATKVGADGQSGGSIAVSSSAGSILAEQALTATGTGGGGGSVVAVATAGTVALRDRVDAEGQTLGGNVFLIGGRGVAASGAVRARGGLASGSGGAVVVASDRDIALEDKIYADGATGGSIQLISTGGALRTVAALLADGSTGSGGAIAVSAVETVIDSACDADGRAQGGTIGVSGQVVRLGNRGTLSARGTTGGTVAVSGAQVSVDPGARVLVDGDRPSGSIAFDATAGDLTLRGEFRARGEGGRIRASASGGLVADGTFAAFGNGCIALTGETIDITGATFDTPPGMSCP